jgi:hypothetical protein
MLHAKKDEREDAVKDVEEGVWTDYLLVDQFTKVTLDGWLHEFVCDTSGVAIGQTAKPSKSALRVTHVRVMCPEVEGPTAFLLGLSKQARGAVQGLDEQMATFKIEVEQDHKLLAMSSSVARVQDVSDSQ